MLMKKAFATVLLLLALCVVGHAQGIVDQSGDQQSLQGNVPSPGRIFIPNAFTPNNDGVNDTYYIISQELNNFTFAVYDRWGNQVFQTNSSNFRWNGERSGTQMPEGTYVYILQAITNEGDTVKRSGQISLVR